MNDGHVPGRGVMNEGLENADIGIRRRRTAGQRSGTIAATTEPGRCHASQVARYLEIGRLIRQDKDVPGVDKLRGRIAAALGDELVAEPVEQEAVGVRFMTPASGIAVAAAVAVVALVGLSQLSGRLMRAFRMLWPSILRRPTRKPTAEQVMLNSPSEQQMDLMRRHGDGDIFTGCLILRLAITSRSSSPTGIWRQPMTSPTLPALRRQDNDESLIQ